MCACSFAGCSTCDFSRSRQEIRRKTIIGIDRDLDDSRVHMYISILQRKIYTIEITIFAYTYLQLLFRDRDKTDWHARLYNNNKYMFPFSICPLFLFLSLFYRTAVFNSFLSFSRLMNLFWDNSGSEAYWFESSYGLWIARCVSRDVVSPSLTFTETTGLNRFADFYKRLLLMITLVREKCINTRKAIIF